MKNILLLALHTTNNIKYSATINNIEKIINNIDGIIIVDSLDSYYKDKLKEYLTTKYNTKILNYYFIENDVYVDFGKYIYAIKNNELNCNNIIFLNDSIFIMNEIDDFFNKLNNYDLYAFTENNEIKYHYQSYLFSIKKNKLNILIDYFESNKHNIKYFNDIIRIYEIELCYLFENKNCHINNLKLCDKNIFNLYNKLIYNNLLKNNTLPIIKIKSFEYNIYPTIFKKMPNDFNDQEYINLHADLKQLKGNQIKQHFLNSGQYEGRKYKQNNEINNPYYNLITHLLQKE